MRRLIAWSTIGGMGLVASAALAADLSGAWEVQSMGADRDIIVEQRGNKLIAHRVMWPEFEGQKYRLEHLYRGTISGSKVRGQLLVKEDEVPEFEVLRDFTASIDGETNMVLDSLPLKRKGGKAPPRINADDNAASGSPAARPSEPPSVSKATVPKKAPVAVPAAANEDPGASLYASIMGGPPAGDNLFRVSAAIQIADEAAPLIEEGDALVKTGKPRAALEKFEQAGKVGSGKHVELLQRMGACHMKLRDYAAAADAFKRALRLDPNNPSLQKDYQTAKKLSR